MSENPIQNTYIKGRTESTISLTDFFLTSPPLPSLHNLPSKNPITAVLKPFVKRDINILRPLPESSIVCQIDVYPFYCSCIDQYIITVWPPEWPTPWFLCPIPPGQLRIGKAMLLNLQKRGRAPHCPSACRDPWHQRPGALGSLTVFALASPRMRKTRWSRLDAAPEPCRIDHQCRHLLLKEMIVDRIPPTDVQSFEGLPGRHTRKRADRSCSSVCVSARLIPRSSSVEQISSGPFASVKVNERFQLLGKACVDIGGPGPRRVVLGKRMSNMVNHCSSRVCLVDNRWLSWSFCALVTPSYVMSARARQLQLTAMQCSSLPSSVSNFLLASGTVYGELVASRQMLLDVPRPLQNVRVAAAVLGRVLLCERAGEGHHPPCRPMGSALAFLDIVVLLVIFAVVANSTFSSLISLK